MYTSKFLPGGIYKIPGDISSQFITALLLNAPYAQKKVEIMVSGDVLSQSYIRQTIDAMVAAGTDVTYAEDFSYFKVEPGEYQAGTSHIPGDFTSASYCLAKAALFPGRTILTNITKNSIQGERAIIDILSALGMEFTFDDEKKTLIVDNSLEALKGEYEFNATDYPNIIPTLAALSAFIVGRFRIVGAGVTRFHKSSRVEAMITELRKLGVSIEPLYKNGAIDGFETKGKHVYDGGISFSSWGDHRIFMSLFVLSLRTKKENCIDGHLDVDCSFPYFLEEYKKMGARYEEM